jgi:hypothetical protein
MEAIFPTETLATNYKTAFCHNSDHHRAYFQRRENLFFYLSPWWDFSLKQRELDWAGEQI